MTCMITGAALRPDGSPYASSTFTLAIFASERYSGTTYTAPSGPFTGSEPDLVALYHLDETTGATVIADAVAA